MSAKSNVLRAAGLVALVSAVVGILGFALTLGLFSFHITDGVLGLALVLTIAGGVLAVLGNRYVAPWLLLAAVIVNFVNELVLPVANMGLLPWETYRFVDYLADDFGSRFAYGLILMDLFFFGVIVAGILGVIGFFVGGGKEVVNTQQGTGAVVQVPGQVVAGWYPDPQGLPCDRYWDGVAWTEQTRPSTGIAGVPASASTMQRTAPANGMGTAALVLGILGLFLFPIIFSILAIIFGSVGIGRVNRGQATNKGASVTGLVLGIVGLVLGLILGAVLFAS